MCATSRVCVHCSYSLTLLLSHTHSLTRVSLLFFPLSPLSPLFLLAPLSSLSFSFSRPIFVHQHLSIACSLCIAHSLKRDRTRMTQTFCNETVGRRTIDVTWTPKTCIWRRDTEYTSCPVLHLPLLLFDSFLSKNTEIPAHGHGCFTTDVSLCSCHGIQLFGWWAVSSLDT